MSRVFLPALCLCALFSTSATQAQTSLSNPHFRLDTTHPASPNSPFLITEGPNTTSNIPWFTASMLLDYAYRPLVLQVDDSHGSRQSPLVNHELVAHPSLSLRLLPSLTVDASWSLGAFRSGESQSVDGQTSFTPQSGAVGDVRIGTLFRDSISSSLGYVGGIRAWIPTGNGRELMSDERFHFELVVGLSGYRSQVRHGCTLFASPLFGLDEPGERLGAGCAFDILLFDQGPRLGAETWGAALRRHPNPKTQWTLEYVATVGHSLGPLHISLGLGRGAGNSPGTSAFRGLGLVRFVPEPSPHTPSFQDRDFDGISDDADACPDEAGPSSDDPQRHGCPFLDRDGDGIEDSVDACPDEKGARTGDPITTGCPDQDNDRIVDKFDACPKEPAPTYESGDKPGCPRYARIKDNQFVFTTPIDPLHLAQETNVEPALAEIAFILRAMPDLTKVAVEVHLPSDELDDPDRFDAALGLARNLVQRLVDLGVESKRLEAIGSLGAEKSRLRVLVMGRKDSQKP